MKMNAREIAERLNGDIIGNPDVVVTSAARIEFGKPGNVCFFANPKYEKYVYTTGASILLVNRSFKPQHEVKATMIAVDDAYAAVAEMLDYISAQKKNSRRASFLGRLFTRCRIRGKVGRGTYVGAFSVIEKGARVGSNCQIYPQVYIGPDVTIGDDVTIYPNVSIYHGCRIGSRCILHSGCVVGSDGFGFAPLEDGSYKKIQQTGNVVIEDDVEVGANTTIDRATMGSTIVRRGVKLDNLIQLAHNTEIGANTVMAAQTGIAGSTSVGEHCVFGGKSGLGGHISVAPNTTFAANTIMANSVKESGKRYMGYPALEYMQFMRAYAKFKQSGAAPAAPKPTPATEENK